MFTGIIQGTGKIINFHKEKVSISVPFLDNFKIGESISVNGMCLTLESFKEKTLTFHLSKESLSKSSTKLWKIGKIVNIERACTPTTLLGGHIVTGHIDCLGVVKDFKNKEILKIGYPSQFSKYLALKGSVAINGISLTVSNLNEKEFEVYIIPHTLKNTNIIDLKRNEKVHLEFDIISKYIERFILGSK